MKRKLLFYILFSLFILSCSSNKIPYSKEKSEKLIVLTTFTILQDMAKNVAGERLIVKSITKPGAEIHNYQFTPSDLVNAKDADLIIENGLGLELWINKFMNGVGNVPRVVLSEGMSPLLIEGDSYSGKPNPHVWMSPKRSIFYVDKILESFIKIDPEGKDYFINNAEIYKSKLFRLDNELRYFLSEVPKAKRFLVSCEGAFSYLAKDYGMKEAYLWPVNSESQVTPRRMADSIKIIKDNDVPTIFCESTVSSKAQRQVAAASGAKFGGDFFVDSLSGQDGPASTLLDLQRFNLSLIQKGLNSSLISK